jgi:hypothetical protein
MKVRTADSLFPLFALGRPTTALAIDRACLFRLDSNITRIFERTNAATGAIFSMALSRHYLLSFQTKEMLYVSME